MGTRGRCLHRAACPQTSQQQQQEAEMQPWQRLASSSHSRSKIPFWHGRIPPRRSENHQGWAGAAFMGLMGELGGQWEAKTLRPHGKTTARAQQSPGVRQHPPCLAVCSLYLKKKTLLPHFNHATRPKRAGSPGFLHVPLPSSSPRSDGPADKPISHSSPRRAAGSAAPPPSSEP